MLNLDLILRLLEALLITSPLIIAGFAYQLFAGKEPFSVRLRGLFGLRGLLSLAIWFAFAIAYSGYSIR